MMNNGLTFKGKKSKEFGFVMKSSNRQLFPDVTRYTKLVPGLHGTVDFGNDTYGEKQISVLLQCNYKHHTETLMTLMEQVSAWLYDDGNYYDLIFDDQPTRIYKAKMATKIDVSPDHSIASLQVTFVCNPPWPYVNGVPLTPFDIIWQTAIKSGNQYMQEFTASGHMRFTNSGTLPVRPVIKLLNNVPAEINLTCGGAQWQYNASLKNDGVIIDCKAETLAQSSNDKNLYTNVDPIKDAYFEFMPGQINIDVTATGLGVWPNNLIIIVEFTPQEVN